MSRTISFFTSLNITKKLTFASTKLFSYTITSSTTLIFFILSSQTKFTRLSTFCPFSSIKSTLRSSILVTSIRRTFSELSLKSSKCWIPWTTIFCSIPSRKLIPSSTFKTTIIWFATIFRTCFYTAFRWRSKSAKLRTTTFST